MDDNLNHIILFDGVCNLCNGVVQFVIKNDKYSYFKFASLQSDFGQQILKKNKLSTTDLDTFIYLENQNLFIKSTAALKVLKGLGGKWKLFYIFFIVPKFIRDLAYDSIAKRRYSIWGKSESCWLPNSDLNSRFLS